MNCIRRASNVAANSSRRGTLNDLSGATFDLPMSSVTADSPNSDVTRMYTAAAYARVEASAKPWISHDIESDPHEVHRVILRSFMYCSSL